MKKLSLIFSICFTNIIFSQSAIIKFKGEIDSDLHLKAKMVFTAKDIVTTDALYIYPFSAGKDKFENPLVKISNIKVNSADVYNDIKNGKIQLDGIKNNDSITIDYKLDLNAIFDWRSSFGYAIFPSSSSDNSWYPNIYVNGSRNFYKNFKVELTYPENLTILTSGNIVQNARNEVQKTSLFQADNIRFFALNAGWDFVVESIKIGKVNISYFCPKEFSDIFSEVATTASKIISWYEKTYGFFPLRHIGIAIGNKRWQGGFPSENLFYIHQGNLSKSFLQWIISHELGHYYWGFHVQSDVSSALMLSNGIWIDHLYLSEAYQMSLEDTWNSGAYRSGMMIRYLEAYLSNVEQRIELQEEEYQHLDFDYNSIISHGKASVGIYLLSREIGFDNFLILQKELLDIYKNKPLSTQDFIDYCVFKGYPFAKTFMKQWYKDHAIIEYEIKNTKKVKKEDIWEYSFEVIKHGTVDYPIEIEVKDINDHYYYHKTKSSTNKELIHGSSSEEPILFNLDPKGVVPMWNSSHPAIQLNYILALNRAGHTYIAKKLAKLFQQKYPNNESLKNLLD